MAKLCGGRGTWLRPGRRAVGLRQVDGMPHSSRREDEDGPSRATSMQLNRAPAGQRACSLRPAPARQTALCGRLR